MALVVFLPRCISVLMATSSFPLSLPVSPIVRPQLFSPPSPPFPAENIFSSNALDSSQAAGWNVRVPLTFSVVIDVAGVMASVCIPSERNEKEFNRAETLLFSKTRITNFAFIFVFFFSIFILYNTLLLSSIFFFFCVKRSYSAYINECTNTSSENDQLVKKDFPRRSFRNLNHARYPRIFSRWN